MKKMKYVFAILLLIILSGCTVNSEVVVDYSGKVEEKVSFLVNTDKRSENEFEKYFNGVYEVYSPALKARDYSNEIIYNKDVSSINFTNKFDNICDYFKSTVFSQYIYKQISCTQTDYYYEIKNETEHISYCSDCTAWPSLDDVKVSIKLPIKAEESNADYVKNNTYTWEFNADTQNEKSFYLKINKNKLKENEVRQSKKQNIKNVLSKWSYLFIILVIIVIIAVIGKHLYKKYEKNKIEY